MVIKKMLSNFQLVQKISRNHQKKCLLKLGTCILQYAVHLVESYHLVHVSLNCFLLLVYIILCITCAEISMVLCYFQLCNEDYRWWWRSILTPGSTAIYVFLYSIAYFSRLESTLFVTYLLYFGYMAAISLGVFIVTGTVGFFSCFYFTYHIYASLKVD